MSSADASPVARLTAIEKRFGAVRANRGASLELARGEIHALVGENGAGKSTLMRILGGLERCDAGRVEFDGRDVTNWSTAAALAAGVGMVHQHFMLVPTLSVAENVVLGREPLRRGRLDRARAEREVEELCAATGLVVPAGRQVADLSVGEAQRVEILKVLRRGARVLLLDEPTAVLSPPEVRELWSVLRQLRERGATIVLVTHMLDEVMAISDRVTVLRQGATVASLRTRETTPAALAQAMVGREVVLSGPVRGVARAGGAAEPVLRVEQLRVRGARVERAVDEVSFTIAPGEILGIAGVEGNGQTELVEAIAGLRAITGGRVTLGGRDLGGLSVAQRFEAGLAHVPEDRQRRGLVLDASLQENLLLGLQQGHARGGLLDRRSIAAHARRLIAEHDLQPPDPAAPLRAFSGGNQQKTVLARELSRRARVLLAAQPTRGVDVGAIERIHGLLEAARAAGQAILLVSADLRELLALSDRVAVMFRGRIVAQFPRGEASAERIGPCMTGAAQEARA